MKKILFFCITMLMSSSVSSMFDTEKSSMFCLHARLKTLKCIPEPTVEQQSEISRLSAHVLQHAQAQKTKETSDQSKVKLTLIIPKDSY